MHCMDSDYSVFTILPPYNTIEAQLIVGGKLVTNGTGYTVTYQAVADPDGSINTTAIGKGNFYDYTPCRSTAPLRAGHGPRRLAHARHRQHRRKRMLFETTNQPAHGVVTPVNWFRAEGIPITPYDDAGRKNPYPLMRLIARNSGEPAHRHQRHRAAGVRRNGLPRLPRLRHAGRRAARRRLGLERPARSATTG